VSGRVSHVEGVVSVAPVLLVLHIDVVLANVPPPRLQLISGNGKRDMGGPVGAVGRQGGPLATVVRVEHVHDARPAAEGDVALGPEHRIEPQHRAVKVLGRVEISGVEGRFEDSTRRRGARGRHGREKWREACSGW